MSSVLEEMQAVLDGDVDALMHYGTKFHSGRYPYGSGEDPYQHNGDFLTRIDRLKKEEGFKETAEEVQKHFGMKLEEYRNEKYWAEYTRREQNVVKAKNMRDKGLGPSAIGKEMGVSESTVRSWLDPKSEAKMLAAKQTADFLKEQIKQKGMIDVGKDVERFINVGEGSEKGLGISRTKLDQALYALESEGYVIYKSNVPQPNNPGKFTLNMTLCPPGTPYQDVYNKRDQIHTIEDFQYQEGTDSFKKKFTYPNSLDSKRLLVRHGDDICPDGYTSEQKDGTIELRRGVEDLVIPEGKRVAQVRILVDGTHYIKGMAHYSDDMPDGVDIVFNSNKPKDWPALGNGDKSILKKIKDDPENPFGSTIKDADDGGQRWYKDPKTGEEKLGLINVKSSEGDWSEWANTVPSQFLSKQSKTLAQRQLDLAASERNAEFESICAINNPTIKKHFLQSFADDCDGAAINLKAAALPNQRYHVIMSLNNQKDTEAYAPDYEDGTKLALVRFPHAGTFEIPVVTVNNKNPLAKKILGSDMTDVIGITSNVAKQLSGADFDGDTVMCIPTDYGKIRIERTNYLKELKGFDPQVEYATKAGEDGNRYNSRGEKVKIMTNSDMEMGVISNLITDMTLSGGASDEEMARAVKHSMVVIDAKKHKLDYKRSEIENNIQALKDKYQVKLDEDGNVKPHGGGAGTIISRAKGVVYVNKRRGQARIDPETGKATYLDALPSDLYYVDKTWNKKTGITKIYTADGKKIEYDSTDPAAREKYDPIGKYDKTTGTMVFTNKAGDITYRTKIREQTSTRMAETDDAHTLVSAARHPMEIIYANYANSMKALANKARKEMLSTGNLKYDSAAKKVYQAEVDALMSRLNEAEKNTVRERQAARLTNASVKAKQAKAEAEGIELSGKEIRKLNQQALTKYRQQVGSVSRRERSIKISDREWEAIQAGAITENKLKRILANADVDELRQRATPRDSRAISSGQANRIQSLSATGKYTIAEIAEQVGVSANTVKKYLKGVD